MRPSMLEHGTQVCATLALLALAPLSAPAEVTRIVIDKDRSLSLVSSGRSFGAAGRYEKLIGLAYGELDPKSPRNSLIQDLQLAPRNSRGMVEYVSAFSLIKPLDMSRASGLLFYEAVNRGNELTQRLLKRGKDDGEEFLMTRGGVILRSGWQGDIPPTDAGNWGERTYSLQVPVATNSDGSPITGPVLVQLVNVMGSTSALTVLQRPVPYLPATMDTRQATLISMPSLSNDGVSGPVKTIPSSDWAWADCTGVPFPGRPDSTKICLKNDFDGQLLYQLVFTAKDPLVLGIGFAATRDIIAFFRRTGQDETGTPNPLAGKIDRVIGVGSSQTGQFLRTFISLGFNEDETGRIVMDGAIPNIAGRQLGLNVRFALPDGTATHYVPDGQGALWWSAWEDPLRGHRAAGLLDRCRATDTCPRIFETFGSAELWGLRMSPGLVGTTNAADIPLPDNVRRYYFPGTAHGGGPGGFSTASYPAPTSMMGPCTLPANPNPSSDTMRALVVALDEWITRGTPPPPSRYPRLSDGTLVHDTRAAVGFPDLLGVPFPERLGNPQFDYDFGPGWRDEDMSGILSRLPPAVEHVIPAMVPRVNADGNEIAGVASVLHQAPLGSYLGWNLTASGFFKGQRCAFVGGYVPFARTKAERLASRDPRPSLEDRYGSQEAYMSGVRAAAEQAVQERFLLREDANRLVQEASALEMFPR